MDVQEITAQMMGAENDQRPVGMARTLVIGVGGTGKEVLTRIRRHLIQGFGSLNRVPIIGFVQLDTDAARPKVHLSEEYEDAGKLRGDEMVHATLAATDLGDDLSKHPHLSWLSPGMHRYDITEGAKQIRQLGRLAFFSKQDRISKAIQAAFQRISNPDLVQQMAEHNLLVDGHGVNVYIIGSLSGGTGGGMILDVAGECRRIMRTAVGARIFGYLVLPEVFSGGGEVQVRANAFAALKEIDYLSAGGVLEGRYSDSAAAAFRMRNKPFTTCYLLNGTNEDGVKLNANQLFDMAGLHIFTDFIPGGIGSLNRSTRDNLSALCDVPDRLGCQQQYMTFGVSRIHFPYDRLQRACSLSLSLALLDRWLAVYEAGHHSARMKDVVEDFCQQNPMWLAGDLRTGIVGKLTLLQDQTTMRENIHGWFDGLVDGARQQGIEDKDLSDLVRRQLGTFESERFYDEDPHVEKWRGYPRQVAQNVDFRMAEYATSLDAEMARRVELDLGKGDSGLSFSIQFLEVLEDVLDGYAQRFQKGLAQCTDQLDRSAREVNHSLDHLHEVSTSIIIGIAGGRKAAVEQAKDRLRQAAYGYLDMLLVSKAYRFGPDLIGRIVTHLRSWRTRLREVQGVMTSLQVDLSEDLTRTRTGVEPGEIYEPADIDEFMDRYLPEGEKRRGAIEDIHRRILDEFGCQTLAQLPEKARSDMDFSKRLQAALLVQARRYFKDIEQISLAERFFSKYPESATQATMIREAYKRAAPYLQFDGVPGFDKDRAEKMSALIGIRGGMQKPPDPAFVQLLRLVRQAAPNIQDKFIVDVTEREKHQLIFIRERAAFPLRAISQMKEYSLVYQDFRSPVPGADNSDHNPPVHIIQADAVFDVFPGVMPPDQAETNKARRAYTVALAWNIFERNGDTLTFKVPRPSIGIPDNKVIGDLNQPGAAIQNLLNLKADSGVKVIDMVLERIEERVQAARQNADMSADLHHRLQQEFIRHEQAARDAYKRLNAELDTTDEGHKRLAEYLHCETILKFLEETGLKAGDTAPPASATEAAVPAASAVVAALTASIPALAPAASRTCPNCNESNPADSKFCAHCVEPLPVQALSRRIAPTHCGSCQTALLPNAKGCTQCGTRVSVQIACGHCEALAPADSRFCPDCSQPLTLA